MERERSGLGTCTPRATERSNYRLAILLTLSMLYLLTYLHRMSPAVLAKALMNEFALSALAISLLSSLYFYPYAFAQVPIGVLSDVLGARNTIAGFMSISVIGCVLFAIAHDLYVLLIARTLIGIGVAGVFVPAIKAISLWFKSDEFASALGVLKTFGGLGAVFSGYVLAVLLVTLGWRCSFLLFGFMTMALTIACWLIVRDPRVAERRKGKSGLKGAAKLILKSKNFWILIVFQFLLNGALYGFQGLWGGPYLIDVYKFDEVQAGACLSLIGIGLIVGAPVIGALSDKVFKSRKAVLSMFSGVFVLTWVPLAFVTTHIPPLLLHLVYFVMGFAGGVVVMVNTILKESFPLSMTGTAVSAVNMFPFLGGAAFQTGMGYVLDILSRTHVIEECYSLAFKLCLLGATTAFICSLLTEETFQAGEGGPELLAKGPLEAIASESNTRA